MSKKDVDIVKKLTHEVMCLQEDIRLLKNKHERELNKYADADEQLEMLEHNVNQLNLSYKCMESRAKRAESVIAIIKESLNLNSLDKENTK